MKEEYTPVSIISEPTNITLKVVLENSGKCYFEWDWLYVSERSWLIWILLCEYFKTIYLYTENDTWVIEKLMLKMHPIGSKNQRKNN